ASAAYEGRAGAAWVRSPGSGSWCRWSCGLPRSRVEGDVNRVSDQVGGEHDQRDHHEHALHQRVVELAQGVVEVEADARVVEDDLDEDLAAHDEADGDG